MVICNRTKRGEKKMWKKLQNWWKYDRPASFWYWVLDMDDDHWWFSPLVSILSSLAGWAIGLWLFSLILRML